VVCQEVRAEYASKILALRAATSLSALGPPTCAISPLMPLHPSRMCPAGGILTWVLFALDCRQLIHFNILACSQICFFLPPRFFKKQSSYLCWAAAGLTAPRQLGGRDQPCHNSVLAAKLSEPNQEVALRGLKTLSRAESLSHQGHSMSHKLLVSKSLTGIRAWEVIFPCSAACQPRGARLGSGATV